MIIVMKRDSTTKEIDIVAKKLKELGFGAHISKGEERCIIGAIGSKPIDHSILITLPGVLEIVRITKPYKLVSKEFKAQPTPVVVSNKVKIGGRNKPVIIAGPCAVENEEQIIRTARAVKKAGASILRGGAFKPRTSPYSFQGLGEQALKLLAKARKTTGLLVVTEVMDTRSVDLVCKYADILQVGARNMQNFDLLKEVGNAKKPVLLKRGMSATLEELLMSAEYVASSGNTNIILCERGIRTMETYTRNTLDLSAIPLLKELSYLPVVVDPSHATGRRDLIKPMSLAAIASGADGVMVEVHPNPAKALSDGAQSLDFEAFTRMMTEVKKAINLFYK